MKIAYLATNLAPKFDGVNKKLLSTIDCWNRMGINAKLFIVNNINYEPPKEFINNEHVEIIRYSNKKDIYLNKQLCDIILEWNPSIVYVRGLTSYYFRSIRHITKATLTVQEINTNDIYEAKYQFKKSLLKLNLKPILYHAFYLCIRSLLMKLPKGFVLLNHELKNIVPSTKENAVVGDGIDLEKYANDNNKSFKEGLFKLVFMGTSLNPWYGIDKIIDMANRFPEFEFHFVGLQRSEINNFNIVHDNIKFHGFLSKDEYEQLFKEMDVAIGSLSLHLINMSEGSPLKTREYLAYGLPTILGYKDTDFFTEVPQFILELPSSKDNVINHLPEIKEFVLKSRSIKIDRIKIDHLDYKIKEQSRIEFMSRLMTEEIIQDNGEKNYGC